MTNADDSDRDKMTAPLEDEHDPPGENQGVHRRFSVDDIARAFAVDEDRVSQAFSGEYSLEGDATVDSRQAQGLAEVILGDRSQDEREAALMQLGAYTPRRDTIAPSVSEKAPGELEDSRLAPDSRRRADVLEDEP